MKTGLLRTILMAATASIALAGITIEPMPGPITVRSGEAFTLTCTSSTGDEVEWTHNNVVVTRPYYEVKESTSDGTSTISTLTRVGTVKADAGEYHCRQKIVSGSFMAASVVVFDIIAEDAIIEKGKDTVLHCNISGLTSYKPLFWQKEGKMLERGNEKYQFGDMADTLTIIAAVSKDSGEYVCGFKINGSDGSLVNHTQIVNVNAKPYINHHVTSSKNKVQGESVELHCEVSGFPVPTVAWYKEDSLMLNGGRVELSKLDNVENASLRISDLTFDDRANYKCVATNFFNDTFHHSNSTILVRVKDKLAALWPFLGICAEVAVLCAIIFIFEKRQSKQLEEEDDHTPNHDMKNSNDHKGKEEVRQRKN